MAPQELAWGVQRMSVPLDRICPIPDCRFNNHVTKAEGWQMRQHLEEHGYKYLLKAAISLNLIEDYAQPKTKDLIKILTSHSLIRSNSHVC